MGFYEFRHPETDERFVENIVGKDKIEFYAPDGVRCLFVKKHTGTFIRRGDREIFEIDPDHVRTAKPKTVTLRNGQKVKYNPSTMHVFQGGQENDYLAPEFTEDEVKEMERIEKLQDEAWEDWKSLNEKLKNKEITEDEYFELMKEHNEKFKEVN